MFPECVFFFFSDRGVKVASQNVLKLQKKKKKNHCRVTCSFLGSSASPCIFFIRAHNHPGRSCGIAVITAAHSNVTRPKEHLHDAAALDHPQRRERWEQGGRRRRDGRGGSEILLKVVSLDTRNWRPLIRSDLNKTPTCFASFLFTSPRFQAAKSAPNGKNTLKQ